MATQIESPWAVGYRSRGIRSWFSPNKREDILMTCNWSKVFRFSVCGVALGVLLLACEARGDQKRLVVWQQPDLWATYTPDLVRPPERSDKTIRCTACINEYASLMVLVASPQNESKTTLRVQVENLKNGQHVLPANQIRVREMVYAKQAWNERVVPDPLLDRESFAVPPRQALILWLTIHTRDAVAGDYRGALSLADQHGRRQSVSLNVTVRPISLPSELPVAFFGFESDNPCFEANLEAHVRDLAEHYINGFGLGKVSFPKLDAQKNVISAIGRPEYVDEKLRVITKYVRRPKILSVFVLPSTISASKNWEESYKLWIEAMGVSLRKVGLGYDDLLVGYKDEFHKEGADAYASAGPTLRTIAPQVKLYGGMGDSTLPEEVQRVAPYVDLWDIPHPSVNPPHTAEKLAFIKSTGKPIWQDEPYLNGGALDAAYGKLLLVPWKVWKYDLQGSDFFTYNRQVECNFDNDNPVSVLEKDDKRNDMAAVIYPTRNGPVGSRRWEAFREGWSQYLCLHLLRNELQKIKTAGTPSHALIQEAVEKVLANPKDAQLAGYYKQRLVDEIIRLRRQ